MTAATKPQDGDVSSREDFPAQNAVAVTPADGTEVRFRSLYIGGTGNLAVIPLAGDGATVVTFVGVPAGFILPVAVRQVRASGTTATSIVGLV